ncbi:TetR/AcrR family transcriptional regulator [Herbiconiux flava]|uniref:AcrR family transcriptional regulator n=1 Tax=Herbiconiux flava TaxID=881268 RepID=A0A852SQI7_9MICO|nr:TetR/AcrR family transcriptional regulator [Herbiconiux flava]NYD71063.1 AcrR family transcriptional regulator [Herbiconiux flava]
MVSVRVDGAMLRASEATCALFIERGTTKLTVAEITRSIGVPVRTFHRYFASKAECVKPLFDWTTATFNEHVRDAPAGSLDELLRTGFERMLGGAVAERTRLLFPLVFRDDEMWSVFLRSVHLGELSLVPSIAARLGVDPASSSARVAAAAVASATRLALEDLVADGADPAAAFALHLQHFGAGIPSL